MLYNTTIIACYVTFAALKTIVITAEILYTCSVFRMRSSDKVKNSCNQAFSSFADHLMIILKEKEACSKEEACPCKCLNAVAYFSYSAI